MNSERAFPVLSSAERRILDAVADGVVVTDAERRIVFLNRRAAAMLALSPADAVGHRCADVLRTANCASDCPMARAAASDDRVENCLMIYRGPRGDAELRVAATFDVLRDEHGEIVGGVEAFREVDGPVVHASGGGRGLGRLVGSSAPMRRLSDVVAAAARSQAPVVVTGEPGAGKRTAALAIHELATGAEAGFAEIDCAACGGADIGRVVADAVAGGSRTIYLARFERLKAHGQRALREIVARAEAGEGARWRVVAASSADVEGDVERGAFDRELFYLLNALQIQVPPLRDRALDVPRLVDHVLAGLNRRARSRSVSEVAPDALDVLVSHDYPGNVKELESIVEHAFARCRGKRIMLHHLPDELLRRGAAQAGAEAPASCDDAVESLEREFMLRVLEENTWQLSTVAAQLGLSRTTLWRKLKRLGIENPRRA